MTFNLKFLIKYSTMPVDASKRIRQMSCFSRAIGLIFLAFCAFNVLGISSAEAETDVTGEQITHNGTSAHKLTVAGGTVVTCTSATLSGAMTEEGKALTATPSYSGCTATSGPATVTMNGCDYLFKAGKEDKAGHFAEGTADLACPEGKKTEVDIYNSEANHKAGTTLCILKIAPFSNKPGVTFQNTEGTVDDLDAVASLGVAYERTGSILCGAAAGEATYTGAETLKAYSNPAHTIQVDLGIGP